MGAIGYFCFWSWGLLFGRAMAEPSLRKADVQREGTTWCGFVLWNWQAGVLVNACWTEGLGRSLARSAALPLVPLASVRASLRPSGRPSVRLPWPVSGLLSL